MHRLLQIFGSLMPGGFLKAHIGARYHQVDLFLIDEWPVRAHLLFCDMKHENTNDYTAFI